MSVPYESLKENYEYGGFAFDYSGNSNTGMYIYDVSGPGFIDGEIHLSAQPPGDGGSFADYHLTPEEWGVGAVHVYYTRGVFAGRDIQLPSLERKQVFAWLTPEKKESLKACGAAFWGAIQQHVLERAANAPEFVPSSGMRADAAEFVPSGATAATMGDETTAAQTTATTAATSDGDDLPYRGPYYTESNQPYWLDDNNQPYFIASDGESYPGLPPG